MKTLTWRQQIDADRRAVMERCGRRCEGSPKYPDCRARDGQAHPETDKPVRLSIIRLEPGQDGPHNMRAMCERCVLSYDFPAHRTNDWRSRRKAMMNLEMFPIEKE